MSDSTVSDLSPRLLDKADGFLECQVCTVLAIVRNAEGVHRALAQVLNRTLAGSRKRHLVNHSRV